MVFHLIVNCMVAMLDLSGRRGREDPEGSGGGLHPLNAVMDNGWDGLNGQN